MALTRELRNEIQTLINVADRRRRPNREIEVSLTNIPAGSTTYPVVFNPPTDGRYTIVATLRPTTGVLGSLYVGVEPTGQTSTGCSITVRNTTALPIAAALVLLALVPVEMAQAV